jgi:hypothetical protein
MGKSLSGLLEEAKKVEMSAADREEQRRSFAFGNANIENEHVTRETVDQAADKLRDEPSGEGQ